MKNICLEGLFSGSSEDIDSDMYVDRLLKIFNSGGIKGRELHDQSCCTAHIEGKTLVIGLPEYGDMNGGFFYLIGDMRKNALIDFMRDTGIRKIRFERCPHGCDAIHVVGDSETPINLGGAVEIEAYTINLAGYHKINNDCGVRLGSKLVMRPEHDLDIELDDKTEIMDIVLDVDKLEDLNLGIYTKNGYLSQDCIDWINKYKNIKIGRLNLKFFHRGVSSNIMTMLRGKRFITQESLEKIIGFSVNDNIISLDVWVKASRSSALSSFLFKRQGSVNWSIARR